MKNYTNKKSDKLRLVIYHNKVRSVINITKGSNLFKVLKDNKIFVDSPCNGMGSCGKCKVIVKKGFYEPSVIDRKHLSSEEIEKGYRLSCSMNIKRNTEIEIIKIAKDMDILTKIDDIKYTTKPVVIKKLCNMTPPTIEDQRDDYERLSDACEIDNLHIQLKDLKNINKKLKEFDFSVIAVLYGNKLLDIKKFHKKDNQGLPPNNKSNDYENSINYFSSNIKNNNNTLYGIAIDIGTTTIALYLTNMDEGKIIDVVSQVNKQGEYGADVISRINYTMTNSDGLTNLNKIIISQLNEMINNICIRNGIHQDDIYDVVIAGNTVMTHLLLGLECEGLAVAPYTSVTTTSMEFYAEELGFKTNGMVSIMPGISSYVGSDITAGVLASGMLSRESYSILLDLGTNGEIVLGNKQGIITCSTAAGPAFEGTSIKCGISGINGAICKVDLSKKVIYDTIGDEQPCGICGSGVLDVVAQLLKHDIIDETGRMREIKELLGSDLKNRLANVDDMKQFILVEKTVRGNCITFTQKDIREVQMAKSAIRAGIEILLKERAININDIDTFYIGGGFGNYMNIESAISIGMIPKEFKGKIKTIGNCAGTGANMYLLSEIKRNEAVHIRKNSKYIELSEREDFEDYFINLMMF